MRQQIVRSLGPHSKIWHFTSAEATKFLCNIHTMTTLPWLKAVNIYFSHFCGIQTSTDVKRAHQEVCSLNGSLKHLLFGSVLLVPYSSWNQARPGVPTSCRWQRQKRARIIYNSLAFAVGIIEKLVKACHVTEITIK